MEEVGNVDTHLQRRIAGTQRIHATTDDQLQKIMGYEPTPPPIYCSSVRYYIGQTEHNGYGVLRVI